MGTNLLQPSGLSYCRNRLNGANTYQMNQRAIKAGYGSSIGRGDLVKFGSGTYQGYIVLATLTDTNSVGSFHAVLPYYDSTQQAMSHGLNGSYQSTSNPSADVQSLVGEDPFGTFIIQCSGGTFAQTWVNQTINFLAGSNGAPNSAGISTMALDFTTLGAPNAPFSIIGAFGVVGGPQDPTNVNPWLEVRLNTSQMLSSASV